MGVSGRSLTFGVPQEHEEVTRNDRYQVKNCEYATYTVGGWWSCITCFEIQPKQLGIFILVYRAIPIVLESCF